MTPDKTAAYLARIADESERQTRFEARAVHWQKWLDLQVEIEVTGGGDVDPDHADFMPEIIAAHHDVLDQEIAEHDAKMRRENGDLRRQIVSQEIAHATERRARTTEAAALRRRIGALETQLAAEREARETLRKEIAGLAKELARDRAHRRLLDARRSYPRSSRVELEKAKRRTDAAIEERLSEGGSFDA